MVGCRLKNWLRGAASGAVLLAASAPCAASAQAPIRAQAVVRGDTPGPVIDRHVYGQFSEHLGTGIYGGMWVGENSPIPNTRGWRNDVISALRELKVPVIRWPGGCFADEYDWREGVGPRSQRPVRVNTNWGYVAEPNTVGTNEFLDFSEMIGADNYVNGDVGSAPARDMASWVEYMTSDAHSTLADMRRKNGRDKPWRVPFFGIGNETWGCGGHMRAEYAADVTRRYRAFIKSPQKIAIFGSGAHDQDYEFTEAMMRIAGPFIDGLTYHYYTIPTGDWEHKGPAVGFGEDQWISTLYRARMMDEQIARQSTIMDKYDPKKRVALVVDEWGVWTDPTPGSHPGFLQQQVSLRDALVAADTFAIFHRHADRVRMAEIAQTVNVLQAMLLTDGPRMVKTPTYWVFHMFRPFMDATSLPVEVQAPTYSFAGFTVPAVDVTAARDQVGATHVALINMDPHHPAEVAVRLTGVRAGNVRGEVLTGPAIDAVNTFDKPDLVSPAPIQGRIAAGVLTVRLPARSVAELDLN